jgi:hypothetical protein
MQAKGGGSFEADGVASFGAAYAALRKPADKIIERARAFIVDTFIFRGCCLSVCAYSSGAVYINLKLNPSRARNGGVKARRGPKSASQIYSRS